MSMKQNDETQSRWYMVNKDGMCTLCADQADAEQEAKNAQEAWPHMGPHRAVRLVEVGDAGFTAGQMVAYADATHAARAQADSVLADAAREYAEFPDAPLSVFSKGQWYFSETGQAFSADELDDAAFVAYRTQCASTSPAARKQGANHD